MVIDLDARRSASATPGRGRSFDTRPVAFVAVLLVILILGGSAAPLPGLRRVLAVENTSGVFALGPGALFTADFGPAPGRQSTVRRHSLDDASPGWSAALPQTVGSLEVVGPSQVLAVESAQVLMTTSVDDLQTTFLDSGTGEILWSTRTDNVLRLTDTSALMTGSAGVRRADLRTGRPLWSRDLGSSVYLDSGDAVGGPPSHVVMADQQGDTVVLDFADGTQLARANLGVAPSDTATYAVVGAHLYLAHRDGDQASLAAYRLSDLQRVWRKTVAPLGRPTWCGPGHLCVATATGLTVLDSDTGDIRWSGRWQWGFDTRAIGLPGPARIAVGGSGSAAADALLDPATGRPLVVLGTSTFVGTEVLVRADTAKLGRTLVQVIGPNDDIRTAGALDSVESSRCAAYTVHLACPSTSGRLNVWRMPI